MNKIIVLSSFCVYLLVICLISTCVQSANTGHHLTGGRLKDDDLLQMDQILRPIKNISRIKLIKMLIKQIKRVAKDDRKQSKNVVSKVKAKTSTNATTSPGKPEFDLQTQRLQQKHLTMLNNQQLFIPFEPASVYTGYTARPLYSFNTFIPAETFQPAQIEQATTFLQGNGQVLQFSLPFTQLNRLPVYVNEQLRSPAGQQVVRAFVEQQFAAIRRSSDPKSHWNQFLNLIRANLNGRFGRQHHGRWSTQIGRRSATARFDMQAVQEGMTRIIGGLVGDLVGIVVEEVLQKRGEVIANGVRLLVGDLATFFISKSNIALELTLKNLSKLLFVK